MLDFYECILVAPLRRTNLMRKMHLTGAVAPWPANTLKDRKFILGHNAKLWSLAVTRMSTAQTFHFDETFVSASYDQDGRSWHLSFSGKVSLAISCLWRLYKKEQLVAIASDHGHRFGRETDMDCVAMLSGELSGSRLTRIAVQAGVGDLLLHFDNDTRLEVIIDSSGYENYDIVTPEARIIGIAGQLTTLPKG